MAHTVNLDQLLNDRRPADVEYFGHKFTVVYNPGAFDSELLAAVRDVEQATQLDVLVEALEGEGYEPEEAEDLARVLHTALLTADASESQAEAVTTALARILVDLGILDDGEPVPCDAKTLNGLPYPLRGAIYAAITDDITPGNRRGRVPTGRAKRRTR